MSGLSDLSERLAQATQTVVPFLTTIPERDQFGHTARPVAFDFACTRKPTIVTTEFTLLAAILVFSAIGATLAIMIVATSLAEA